MLPNLHQEEIMRIVQPLQRAAVILALLAVGLTACGLGSPTNSSSISATSAPASLVTVGPLPAPIMAGSTSDNLPTYTCAADAFASYYTLQAIQQNGLDVAHGFHLGIVP